MLQVTGLAQSAAVIGKRNMAQGIMAYLRHPQDMVKQTLPRGPGAPSEVSAEEKARLWSAAEKMAERDIGKARTWIEEIRREETLFAQELFSDDPDS